ncbi:MAG: hypothetical protein WD773_10165 [Gemmatimonadales bacterium]
MANKVQIKLTPEQREVVRQATGKTADSIELTAQELEERIAPMSLSAE